MYLLDQNKLKHITPRSDYCIDSLFLICIEMECVTLMKENIYVMNEHNIFTDVLNSYLPAFNMTITKVFWSRFPPFCDQCQYLLH